jgi:hypothetical protein
MINIKNLELNDLLKLEELFDANHPEYPIPQVMNNLYTSKKAIFENDDFIGAAFAWVTTETSLILSDRVSKIGKAKILKEVFKVLLNDLQNQGFEDTHVFVLPDTDEKYAEFLIKHFGFVRAKGIPLYRRRS